MYRKNTWKFEQIPSITNVFWFRVQTMSQHFGFCWYSSSSKILHSISFIFRLFSISLACSHLNLLLLFGTWLTLRIGKGKIYFMYCKQISDKRIGLVWKVKLNINTIAQCTATLTVSRLNAGILKTEWERKNKKAGEKNDGNNNNKIYNVNVTLSVTIFSCSCCSCCCSASIYIFKWELLFFRCMCQLSVVSNDNEHTRVRSENAI